MEAHHHQYNRTQLFLTTTCAITVASVCFTARYVAQTGSEIERKAWESRGYRREFYDINVSTPAAGNWRLWYWVKEQVCRY